MRTIFISACFFAISAAQFDFFNSFMGGAPAGASANPWGNFMPTGVTSLVDTHKDSALLKKDATKEEKEKAAKELLTKVQKTTSAITAKANPLSAFPGMGMGMGSNPFGSFMGGGGADASNPFNFGGFFGRK